MDEIAGAPVYGDIVRQVVTGGELPELTALYADLGIEITNQGVRLRDTAPLATIRDAIMKGRAAAELAH